ncbi:MAG: SufE family protein [Deltaproteobacteria bacterium]
MNISEREKEIIDEFEMFDDWMDKYNYIIDIGKNSKGIDDVHKIDENLVFGCTSQVWLFHQFKDGKLYFFCDSDAFIPKGIVTILKRIYDESEPLEIMNHMPVFMEKTGLSKHLTPNRTNGLVSMIEKIRSIANGYLK